MADVVCFGQQNWDYCWTGKQQLMTRLVRRGHRVLYIDPDLEPTAGTLRDEWRALRPAPSGLGLREFQPGLWVATIPYARALRWRLNIARRPGVVAAIARRLGFHAPVALSHRPDAWPMVEALRPSATLYYAIDEWSAYGVAPADERPEAAADRAWRQRMRELEEEQIARVDVALAISPRLLRRIAPVHPRSYLLESAADLRHFSPENLERAEPDPDLARLARPRLGFVGQVDERLDHHRLIELARARRDWQIILAGRIKPGYNAGPLAAEPNIHLLGYRPYEELPGVVREFDACLAPYRRNELTESCSPLKVFEYLATGKPVIATPLDGLASCLDVISPAESSTETLAAIDLALADPSRGRRERLERAAANDWEGRADDLEARIEEALEVAGRRRGGARVTPRRPSDQPPAPEYADDRPSLASRLAVTAVNAAGRAYHAARVAGRSLRRDGRPLAVRKILLARQARLGDLVVFGPTLAALRSRFPHARIVLGVQPGMSAGPILERSPDVDEVRVLDHLSQESRLGQLSGAWTLFAEGFDVVIHGAGWFLIREAFFAGAPIRLGLDDGHPLQRSLGRVIPLDPTRHESENNLALAEALGSSPPESARVPDLTIDEAAVSGWHERISKKLGLPPDVPVLTLHAGSQKPSRRWPPERFAELTARLLVARPALHVAFSGTPGETDLIESIREAISPALRDRTVIAAGRTDLAGLLALMDRSAAFACNDTGVMHLARARGTPLVALLGPENHRRWGPHPGGPAPAVALRHDVPCAPCNRWDCEALYCLKSLTVDEVEAEVAHLLDSGRASHVDPLQSLTTRLRRHGWSDLSGAGFELPVVSLLVDDAERPIRDLLSQDYPRLEILLPRGTSPPNSSSSRVRITPDPGRSARGDLLAVVDDRSWPPDAVSNAVAAWLRSAGEVSGIQAVGPVNLQVSDREPPRSPSACPSRTEPLPC